MIESNCWCIVSEERDFSRSFVLRTAVRGIDGEKRAEGKHYYVAVSHAAKKLVRLIYQLEKSHQPYNKAA